MNAAPTLEAERLKEADDVKRALHEVSPERTPPKVETKDRLWFGSYLMLLLGIGALHWAFSYLSFFEPHRELLLRFTRGAVLIVVVLGMGKLIEMYLIGRVADPVSKFNLRRIAKLIRAVVVALIFVSMVFVNWYTAVVSLGLISLILGFALQTPITSFIGWVYILARQPYRVGDRIKINGATGDVIDVGYLDTTLWEFHGDHLSTDHPSGRLIKFPNAKVLDSMIYNYSWPVFPYVWNEIKFHVAYESDLEFVARVMQETVAEELGEKMMERVKTYRELLAHTPVDELEVQERPSVQIRVNSNTWLEVIVRYVVFPKEAGRVKTRLVKTLLAKLNAEPDKVMFPKAAAR